MLSILIGLSNMAAASVAVAARENPSHAARLVILKPEEDR